MPKLGPSFYKKLLKITSEVGMKPEDLLKVMAVESGLNPAAHNKNGNASGLVQFMPSTLKAMGYKGTHEDFRQLSAEAQLDYVQGLIKNMMKINGGPFTSAEQYYVGNFIPLALRLPGIKAGDPKTIIVAKNPDKPHLPGISIALEKNWYNANPTLDANKDGLITFGDIQTVLNKAASGKTYQIALSDMENATGYQPKARKPMKKDEPASIDNILDTYLHQIAASQKKNKNLYKSFLPNNNILIQIAAQDFTTSVEFSRILCSALEEELLAQAYTHTDGDVVEVNCSISGPDDCCLETVKQLSNSIVDAFKTATTKIGNIDIKTNFVMNKQSSYQAISFDIASLQYRKFLLKFV